MKFRRRVKLFSGFSINFSKSGISTTIGPPGFNFNIGGKGAFLNTGIPGTGLYDRTRLGSRGRSESGSAIGAHEQAVDLSEDPANQIRTENIATTTTEGLHELHKELLDCYNERREIIADLKKAESNKSSAVFLEVLSYILIIGIFIPWFRRNRRSKSEYIVELQSQRENCLVNVDIEMDAELQEAYRLLRAMYENLLTCEMAWDLTSSYREDQKATKSAASVTVVRKIVKLRYRNLSIIKSKYEALHFENANGGDIFIYPAFVAIVSSQKEFGLIGIKELKFEFQASQFMETDIIPKDAKQVGTTWAKVNKDGSPDMRFKENYEIPIVQYGEMKFKSDTGLNEVYVFSCADKAGEFALAMKNYISEFN